MFSNSGVIGAVIRFSYSVYYGLTDIDRSVCISVPCISPNESILFPRFKSSPK